MKLLTLIITLLIWTNLAHAGPLQPATFKVKEAEGSNSVEKFTVKYGTESGSYPVELDIPKSTDEWSTETVLLDVDVTYYYVFTATNQRGETGPTQEKEIVGKPSVPVGGADY